jgi:hypothetical protein
MRIKEDFKEKAKELGAEFAELANKEGNDLAAQLKSKPRPSSTT